MSEIETRRFLKSILDDLAEEVGLPRGNRKRNDPLYRAYEFNYKIIKFGIVDQQGSWITNQKLVEPSIKVEVWADTTYCRPRPKILQKEIIPLADVDYVTKAAYVIKGGISSSMSSKTWLNEDGKAPYRGQRF